MKRSLMSAAAAVLALSGAAPPVSAQLIQIPQANPQTQAVLQGIVPQRASGTVVLGNLGSKAGNPAAQGPAAAAGANRQQAGRRSNRTSQIINGITGFIQATRGGRGGRTVIIRGQGPQGPAIRQAQAAMHPARTVPRNALPRNRLPARVAKITILNPKQNKAGVSFLVDGQLVDLKPGFLTTLEAPADMLIEFDRGNTFGDARYTLKAGTYKFDVTPKGWELFSVDDKP